MPVQHGKVRIERSMLAYDHCNQYCNQQDATLCCRLEFLGMELAWLAAMLMVAQFAAAVACDKTPSRTM